MITFLNQTLIWETIAFDNKIKSGTDPKNK